MSQEENFKTLWAEYSKLVLKELDRMNNNYENLRENIEDINAKLNDVKNTEKSLQDLINQPL